MMKKIPNSITVQAFVLWLKQKWVRLSIVESSDLRKWGLHRAQPVDQILRFYRFSFKDPNNGKISLLYHKPLLLYCIYDFSAITHYFIKKMANNGFPNNDDTCSFRNMRSTLFDDLADTQREKKSKISSKNIISVKMIHFYVQ
jgi:hypothetical protein